MTFRSPSRNPASWMVWSGNGAFVVNVSSKCRWVALLTGGSNSIIVWTSCRCASQAVLDILWGRKALGVEEDGELRRDATWQVGWGGHHFSLRCLMRRDGWERHDEEVPAHGRNVTNRPSTTRASVWNSHGFGARIIAHADSTLEALRNRHDPMVARELRASRTMVFSERRPRMCGHFWNMWYFFMEPPMCTGFGYPIWWSMCFFFRRMFSTSKRLAFPLHIELARLQCVSNR